MKSYTIVHILLFLVLLLAYQCAGAQDLIITSQGDTLSGEVDIFNYGADKKLRLVTGGEKKFLSIFKVRNAKIGDDVFEPVKREDAYAFMKVIRPGYLTLYGYQADNQNGFDALFLVKRDGARMEVPNLAFKKTLGKFLADCRDVATKIENGDLAKKDIHTIVDQYNSCIEARSTTPVIANAQPVGRWNELYNKVDKAPDFSDKRDALDMITEIRTKTARGEKIPNFLIEGLKASLEGTDLKAALTETLNEEGN